LGVEQSDFVDVATSATVATAEAAAAKLKAAGIDARLREAPAPADAGGAPEIVVMVPAAQMAAALDLLKDEAASPDHDTEDRPVAASEDSTPAIEPSVESIATELERIRRRRRLMWFWVFSYLPAAVFTTVAGPDAIVVPVVLLWLAAYLLAFALAARSRCPRCGKRFCRNEERWDPYTPRCLNCGLPLDRPVAVAPDATA
jgi:hypothetical protein